MQIEHKFRRQWSITQLFMTSSMTSFYEKVISKNNKQKKQLTPTSILALPISPMLFGEFVLAPLFFDASVFWSALENASRDAFLTLVEVGEGEMFPDVVDVGWDDIVKAKQRKKRGGCKSETLPRKHPPRYVC
jgi:hypothetical protein